MLGNKWIFLFLAYVVLPVEAFSLDANSVSIDADQYVSAGEPVEVSVLVTHEKSLLIDTDSFTMGGKKLQVNYDKEIKMSPTSGLVISIYKFTIPSKKQGSYTIPSVSVDVGGKAYTSYEGFYEVK